MRALLTFVGFQAGWASSVLGAAKGLPWLGPAVVALLLVLHLRAAARRAALLRLLAWTLVLGVGADTLLTAGGLLVFAPSSWWPAWLPPAWMAALWLNFALLIPPTLRWLAGRDLLAAVLGFLGGPLAYYTGAELGALQMHSEALLSLAAVGVEYACVTPLLLRIAFPGGAGKLR